MEEDGSHSFVMVRGALFQRGACGVIDGLLHVGFHVKCRLEGCQDGKSVGNRGISLFDAYFASVCLCVWGGL